MSGPAPRLSVILASTAGPRLLREALESFCRAVDGRGEVVAVDADAPETRGVTAGTPWRVLRAERGRLAPQLWSLGIDATTGEFVGLSTTQMGPVGDWPADLIRRMESTGAAAVGGPIEPAPGLGTFDRAVYLHRYLNYLRPDPDAGRHEPPGDNALYRRSALLGLDALWRDGFWEVEIHRRLRERGETLEMAPEAPVRFRGGSAVLRTLGLRLSHARRYGASRAGGCPPLARVGRVLRSPIVPPLLLARTGTTLRRHREPIGRWAAAFAPLAMLATAWAAGEAVGAISSPPSVGMMDDTRRPTHPRGARPVSRTTREARIG